MHLKGRVFDVDKEIKPDEAEWNFLHPSLKLLVTAIPSSHIGYMHPETA